MKQATGTTQHDVPQQEQERLLVGACELGLLELAWEYFINKPRHRYLFVIDAPTISSVYALPPHNIAHFGIAGLLEAPEAPANLKGKSASARQEHYKEEAKRYPLTLGLTEILARYLFERRWSGGEPKLMMPSQTHRVGELMDVIGRHSSIEFSQTYKHSGDGNPLQDLQKRFMSDRNSNAKEFIDEITEKLEKYLPAIYGAYTNTRQLFRYAEALPFPDRLDEKQATIFAHSYKEINDLLEQASKETLPANVETEHLPSDEETIPTLVELTEEWRKAIPRSGGRTATDASEETEEEGTEYENARTLAEIEYLNRQFCKRNMPQRLVFVTTTGRLFDAALMRHGVIYHGTKPKLKYGSANNFSKCFYLSRLLTGDNPDLALTPILDPRALMTSSDFVNYANRENKTPDDDIAREISAWLPAFFANYLSLFGELDDKLVFNTYRHYQIGPSRGHQPKIIRTDSFSPQQYSGLKDSWNKYIRIVSTAEGADRIMQRERFHDIRMRLLGGISLQDLMGKRLDDAMSKWLSIVGGNALQATLHVASRKGTATTSAASKFRVVPPLILPSFSSDRVSLFKLMQHLHRHGPHFEKNQFTWLTDPKASDFEIAESDPRKTHKKRYIQMLGQAVLFASLNNWDAAFRLATQSYALAEQFLREETERDKPTYVSGREAAYFASVAARRLRTSWEKIDRPMSEGLSWIAKYRRAINDETYIQKFPLRQEMLLLRGDLEQVAWDVFVTLYRMYRSDKLESLSLVMSETEQIEYREECLSISERLSSDDLNPEKNEAQFDTQEARQAYAVTHTYLLRQAGSIGLHVELLLAGVESQNHARINELVQLIAGTICQNCNTDHEDCLPLSNLEQLLLLAGCKVAGISPPVMPETSIENQEKVGFGQWRYEALRRIAGVE